MAYSKLPKPTGSITANPNPIILNDRLGLGVTSLKWMSLGTELVEVHIDKPDGPLFLRAGSSGEATTGKWVRNKMTFYLQDVSEEKPLTSNNTLSSVKIEVVSKDPLVNLEAWSWGQIASKLWLCNVLESLAVSNNIPHPTIWILAGWYGLLAFLLLSREKIGISMIRSFDLDPETEEVAAAINNRWSIEDQKFKAFIEDVNNLDYASPYLYLSGKPDIIINTSCEHIVEKKWFDRIPAGTLAVLQSTDMHDADHINRVQSIEEFKNKYAMNSYFFENSQIMAYNNTSYTRFMIIGMK